MTASSWLLLTAGTVVTTLAVVLFLFTLWLGLHRQRWLPLIVVTALWLLAMTLYALIDSSDTDDSSRRRIADDRASLSVDTAIVEVRRAAG